MNKLIILLFFTMLALTGCEREEMINESTEGVAFVEGEEKSAPRPFVYSFQNLPGGNILGPCVLNNLDGFTVADAPAEGKATHLGKTTSIATSCFRPYLPPMGGPGGPVPGQFESSVTTTAANGDQLFISVSWESFPNEADPSLADLLGTYTITGGTGRFEGASGSGTGSGVADADPFNPRFLPYGKLEGTILY